MKTKYILLNLFLFMTIMGQSLNAQFSYKVNFTSRYIWRGFDLNPGKQPAIQPSVNYTLGDSGLDLNLWGSISFIDQEAIEIDFNLTYTFLDRDLFSLSVGFINYGWFFKKNFKMRDDTSQEIFISADFKDVFLNPGLIIFYDFANGNGFYISTKVGHRINFSKSSGIDFSASLGFNGGQWLADGADPGFSDLNVGISYPFYLRDFKITPFINYTNVLLDAIGKEDHYWFGISINFAKNNNTHSGDQF